MNLSGTLASSQCLCCNPEMTEQLIYVQFNPGVVQIMSAVAEIPAEQWEAALRTAGIDPNQETLFDYTITEGTHVWTFNV